MRHGGAHPLPIDAAIQEGLMPSLLRFLTALCLIGAVVYGGMFALANWFNPKPREITVSVPADKFAKQH
jgi:hypothetical protein